MTESVTRRPVRGVKRLLAMVMASCLALAGCAVDEAGENSQQRVEKAGEHLDVFTTTGYLGDIVMNLDPDATVTVMVAPGGDPHTYQPSTKDIEKMQDADVVFWNGLHLEAQMIDQLRGLGDKQLEVGTLIPEDMLLPWPEQDDEGNALFDPHIWNSSEIWKLVTGHVADKLSEANPEKKDQYQKNAEAYIAMIDEMDARAKEKLSAIPDERRILVTGHDAFAYFGHVYGLEVLATDFVTSESEMSAQELDELAKTIADNKLPMIFQDNLKNPQAITALKEAVQAKGWDVEVSDHELYADSLGDHSPVDTYQGVFNHNVDAVAEALGD
ncbi:MAG: zinc ABC transporter substrate-binding protein [Bowdeniella nasicola]|nr:zinc ABC transporter substrate-binding protein [Bowdeniella nasicola]